MYTDSRDEEVKLLKRLWSSQPTICPKCGGAQLEHLHKKAKKSDCDWKCPVCGMAMKGQVTIPTDMDVIDETIRLAEKWGQTPYVTVTGQIFPLS